MQQLPLIQRAIGHAERLAICTDRKHCTYADLIGDSASVAAALLQGSEDLREARVAFLIPPSDLYIATLWGIWRAGGIALPLSLSAAERELEYVLSDAQVRFVVTTAALAEKLVALCQRQDIRLIYDSQLRAPTTGELPEIAPERRALILYTSGTTSRPKGVVTTHDCIQSQIESLVNAWEWQADDRIPSFLPLHHIHGIINVVSCALWSGAQIEAFQHFESAAILGRVRDRAYTVFMAVPTIYIKLIEAMEAKPADERQAILAGFGSMRLMVSGSAALPSSVHRKWWHLTGQPLLERYGMTEIGMALSNPYRGERRAGSVGRPLPGVEVRLISDEGEIVTEEGIPGEIQVRGRNVFLEYWNQPEATRASFVDDWFRTGDIAVVDDDSYRIMGRKSVDIIKSGGYKLSALEIEAALLDHPSIAQCAVLGIPDVTWGERVAAVVVPKAGQSLCFEELQRWCTGCLSHYKVPRKWLLAEQLPRNAMGKVTKPALRQMLEAVDGAAGSDQAPPSKC